MPVTIYEVAERAGVSSSTVARIMRGDVKEVQERSAETANRVRRIAKELGYRTNRRARALSRGVTHGIGLLYSSDRWLFEGVNTQVINSLVGALQEDGYHLVFVPLGGNDGWEDIIRGGQIDGAVTFQPLHERVSSALAESNVGVVALADDSDASLSQVLVDDYAGAYAATRHLLKLGHRQLLYYVHESVKQHCSVHERRRGYGAAASEHGQGLEAKELIFVPEEEAVSLLVSGDSRPTGVLCYSNLEATLLCHAMWQYGVGIPRDISILGFNDMFSTKYMTPPLTTVAFDAERIGKLGAELILKTIGPKATSCESVVRTIKPKLIVRGSTGPAPDR